MNAILSLYDYRLSDGDTQEVVGIPAVIEKNEYFALTGGGDTKTSPSRLLAPEPPGETFTIFKIKLRSFRRLWQKNQVFIQETTTNNSSNCV